MRSAIFLVVLVALAAAWRWTPLGSWLDVAMLVEGARPLRDHPFTPLLVMAWLRRRFGKPDAGAARPSTPDEEERAQLPDDKSDAPTQYVRGGFL